MYTCFDVRADTYVGWRLLTRGLYKQHGGCAIKEQTATPEKHHTSFLVHLFHLLANWDCVFSPRDVISSPGLFLSILRVCISILFLFSFSRLFLCLENRKVADSNFEKRPRHVNQSLCFSFQKLLAQSSARPLNLLLLIVAFRGIVTTFHLLFPQS